MANCKNCGAGMPKETIVCPYCSTRQDVDLKQVHKYTVEKPVSERICPRCDAPMQTIDLKLEGKFLIERCESCLGMFFDPGELEALLDKSVSNVYTVDFLKLEAIQNAKRHGDYDVTYIKCPVCRKLMNRVNFANRSGVIIDHCRDHGLWLDGGELRQLMEWTKAGGNIHQQKVNSEYQKILKEDEERKRREEIRKEAGHMGSSQGFGGGGGFGISSRTFVDEHDIFSMLTRFARRFLGF